MSNVMKVESVMWYLYQTPRLVKTVCIGFIVHLNILEALLQQ